MSGCLASSLVKKEISRRGCGAGDSNKKLRGVGLQPKTLAGRLLEKAEKTWQTGGTKGSMSYNELQWGLTFSQ
eukprot:1159639-Pelagomonas_calceolata.AAC.1